jgi:hypothetical protein
MGTFIRRTIPIIGGRMWWWIGRRICVGSLMGRCVGVEGVQVIAGKLAGQCDYPGVAVLF